MSYICAPTITEIYSGKPRNSRRAKQSSKELVVYIPEVARKQVKQGTRKAANKAARAQSSIARNLALPYQQGMVVTNASSDKRMLFRRSELAFNIVIGPTTPEGTVFTFPLNIASPTFKDTVIQQLASVFQKFRFKRCSLRFSNVTGTVNGGALIGGYTENPDQQVSTLRQTFNLTGSKTFPLWMPETINAHFKDPRMYNIDDDSTEIMQTTQGKFVFALQSKTNTTGDTTYPLILDYEVEFEGAATQSFLTPLPSGFLAQAVGSGQSGGHGNFVDLAADTGYINSANLATNAGYTSANPIWQLSSPVEVATIAGNVVGSFIRVRAFSNPSNVSVQFFETLEDARVSAVDTSAAIQNSLGPGVANVLAQTVQQVL